MQIPVTTRVISQSTRTRLAPNPFSGYTFTQIVLYFLSEATRIHSTCTQPYHKIYIYQCLRSKGFCARISFNCLTQTDPNNRGNNNAFRWCERLRGSCLWGWDTYLSEVPIAYVYIARLIRDSNVWVHLCVCVELSLKIRRFYWQNCEEKSSMCHDWHSNFEPQVFLFNIQSNIFKITNEYPFWVWIKG